MKTFLVLVGLLSVLAYPVIVAHPLNSDSSQETKEGSDNSSNEAASTESVYLIKEVSYEVGVVDTVDLGNSSQVVVVKPEDRVETDDITLWTSKNAPTLDNENTTSPAPAETTLSSVDAGSEEVNRETTSTTSQKVEQATSANKGSSA